MSSMASSVTTRSRCDGLTWLFLPVRAYDLGASRKLTLRRSVRVSRSNTMLTVMSSQAARSTRARELTLTSPPPILARPMVAHHYQTLACTLDPISPENGLCPKKRFPLVAFCNLVHHHTLTLANIFPPAALRTRPRPARVTSLRTRRSGGDRRKLKHSRERRRQQCAANRIHLLEGGDRRSRRTPSPLNQDLVPNNTHSRKPHHHPRHLHCP